MAHFAKLDDNNLVVEIHCVHNNELLIDGVEVEEKGINFLTGWSGGHTNWRQTSYNGTFRKNYAGIGYTYDPDRDAFIPPQPFPSWTLNEDTCIWQAPVPMSMDGKIYSWDELTQTWISSWQQPIDIV